MTATIQIIGGNTADSNRVGVSQIGELTVGPYAFDQTEFNELAVINTAYNFFKGTPGSQFVVTGIVAFADKEIANNSNTEIVVYEGISSTTTTVSKVLIQFGLGSLTSLAIMPMRILVNEGLFVNAKTSDDDIHMTIMGYFVPRID